MSVTALSSAPMPAYMSDPTDEQLAALNMAMDGKSFKVVAYAGAGKTTTLKLIAERLRGRGLYLAFNKGIANEAKQRFPGHVDCRTFHSLAYRHVPRDITAKLSLPRFSPKRLGDDLGLRTVQVRRQMEGKTSYINLTPARQARFVSDAVSNFCSTHASYPAPRHLIFPSWISAADEEQLREILYPAVEKRWLQSIDARHPAGIGHDIYLKLWALSKPIIPAEFILFDEAQDADPLMMGILTQQQQQVIYVGDAHQQIYEWRGAVNAMKKLPLPQTLLTQSFRFGEDIADVANLFLKALQEEVPLRGNPNKTSSTAKITTHGKKDAILCRTNAAAMAQLLAGLKNGHKVALKADADRMLKFCKAAESLKAGKSAYGVPELAYFYNWSDVQDYSETNEGSDLKTLVKLVDDHGTEVLSQAVNSLTDVRDADYVISTAHKAKGLEWDRVQLDDDFYYDVTPNGIKISPEELRLLYVACTRAKDNLDIHNISDLISGFKSGKKVIYGS
ncbi:UvrD-helicase domain-containing protein [Psychrobacter sanguinis]|uniref:UvrD-helicase domain-containing protein n=1 Tax=Psychrobacter sanguinis TaxID=861445 RepID=UPI00020C7E5E|nr:UvrD-helicase domain-containing protein [Psychrobacter sanguinis]EGK12567.1 superfamily I DNA/RNA helicase family protein [Psychrobacter sp. 1501(2011)]MCD9151857.1 AAA family ATPase [Psychrobacter sanguinis]HBH34259.1 ATP-dependent helicase [Psychrobacter sp.]